MTKKTVENPTWMTRDRGLFIRIRCKAMALPVAIPHMADSRAHQRYLDDSTLRRIPYDSGRYRVQRAVFNVVLLLLLLLSYELLALLLLDDDDDDDDGCISNVVMVVSECSLWLLLLCATPFVVVSPVHDFSLDVLWLSSSTLRPVGDI